MLLKYRYLQSLEESRKFGISYISALLLIATLAVFVLSGSHIHEGAESFTSPTSTPK